MKALLLSDLSQKVELRGVNIDTVDKEKYFPIEYKKTDGSGEIVIKKLPDCETKYRRILNDEIKEMTTEIKEMTTTQKNAVDQAEVDAIAQKEANAKDITKWDTQIKAVAFALGKQMGATEEQIKNAVKAEYEALNA
jgi:hypothetical protein